MGVLGIVTALNDDDKKKSCGACVHFKDTHEKGLIETFARKREHEIKWFNQQSMGAAAVHKNLPECVKATRGWYPKVFYMDDANWKKAASGAKDVKFEIYNGEMENGAWKLKSKPMDPASIHDWVNNLSGAGGPPQKRVAQPSKDQGAIVVGRRWRHQGTRR